MDLIDTIRNLSVSRRRSLRDDDFFVDRLHHRYTVAMLVLFCAVVTTNQYAGEPINCWVPAQFTGSFETYTNRLCWLQNTYYVEENHDIPDDMAERSRAMLKYYQWVHLIILLQSVLFIIPRVIWRSLNDKCGIEIVNFVDAAIKFETVEQYAQREKLMEFLTGHVQAFIHAKDSYKTYRGGFEYRVKKFFSYFLFWTGKRFGNYLVILYTFVKLLYLANVVGQLFLMTRLLGISNYYMLGFEILNRMALGLDMIKNHYFPKVTHCDFKIRELGNDHQYTVQCVLSINIFTEKIYIILWFWFVVLSILTFVDLVLFLFKNGLPSQRYFYVKKHVIIFSSLNQPSSSTKKASAVASGGAQPPNQLRLLNEFSNKFLKPDVVLVLKIIATNVNGLVVSELVKYLWETFLRSKSVPENYIQEYDYGDAGNGDDEHYEDDDEEDKAAAFPLNRQPIEDTTTAKPSAPDTNNGTTNTTTNNNNNNNGGAIRRILGLNKPKNDRDPNVNDDATKTIKAGGGGGGGGEKQTSTTPIAIV